MRNPCTFLTLVDSLFGTQDIFAAGSDTSLHAVEWAISECIRNPTVMREAQLELDEVVSTTRRVEDSNIPNLKYLQAICKETFRLHIPSTILLPHMNPSACKLFGYDIPAETTVMVYLEAMGRDPSIWKTLWCLGRRGF